mgnify:CR=1 FL=1|tara:strand:- start:2143 stop:2805 length:663 start_codon:yes stop_codon:yes gene_type:complete
MATSDTVTWRPEVEEIITEACERCGVDPAHIDRKTALSARRSINLLFSEWSVRGINYWTTTESTLTLTASTRVYTLPVGTVDVLDAVLRRSSSDTQMTRLALTDYNALPNKTSEGLPINFFFDRQYTPQLYLWPVPENSTDTLIYWQMAQPDDVASSQQNADMPYRWTDAMCAGLAAKLAMKIPGVSDTRITMLAAQAETSFNLAATEEGEKAALKIIPA